MVAKLYNVHDALNTPAQEAYRVLRSNIQFCGVNKKVKTIAITSSNPGEGKTTTTINLGISMARSGMKVLLVDTDLRKPMLVKHLGSENVTGLTNFISGAASFDDVINETSVENFYFIGSGPKPPNPAELIGSAQFSEFMRQASEQFDLVLFDTPPLGSVIDCALIAAQTDGVVIVIKSKGVSYRVVQRIKDQLEKANAKILGVVLNRMKKTDFRYYYSYYNYYGSSPQKEKKVKMPSLFKKKQIAAKAVDS